MKSRVTAVIFALVSPYALSQLTIENPKQQDVPEAQARVLLQMSVQAVAKELRPAHTNAEFPLRLVIGQEDERFGVDEKTGVPTLFLRHWDPMKFTTAAVMFAIQKSLRPERQQQMVLEIVRRSKNIAPISAAQLRGSAEIAIPGLPTANDCLKDISDSTSREPPCRMIPGHHAAAK